MKLFYLGGKSSALHYAARYLENMGYRFSDTLQPEVTHILLDVPTPNDEIHLPETTSPNTCIIGGNLPPLGARPVLDLLQDPQYVAENAYITAHCAVKLAMNRLPIPLRHRKILVIGWGRIGKCLATLLKSLEAEVTVAARKESDRAMLTALGYEAIDTKDLSGDKYRIIFNTVPAMILTDNCPCQKIDLASSPGIAGQDVLIARGLPGKEAPEASGELIARRIDHYLKKGETE